MKKLAKSLPGRDEERGMLPIWRVSSIGIEMGVAVAVGWGIGWWLDGRFGTAPWFMIGFLLVGVAAGFKGMFAAAREMRQRDQALERQSAAKAALQNHPNTAPRSEADRDATQSNE